MSQGPDVRARYEPRTETVHTGTGHAIRLRDLYGVISRMDAFSLRKLVSRAGVTNGVNDPMEAGEAETVRDLLDICRGLPQHCLPIVRAGLTLERFAPQFDELIRDRMIGSARKTAATRDANAVYSDKIGTFFYQTRGEEGEYGYFIRHDKKAVTLRAGQRFAGDGPYRDCFLVLRTSQGRYFLRWPSAHAEVPAWYVDGQGGAVHFFPRDVEGEAVDFEELFPGYTYEVFGVRFALPDIGTDYRDFLHEVEETEVAVDAGERPLDYDRKTALLEILELEEEISTARELSKHFRRISLRYHPLKHLQASPEEKERINQRYLEITNAYNELKAWYA